MRTRSDFRRCCLLLLALFAWLGAAHDPAEARYRRYMTDVAGPGEAPVRLFAEERGIGPPLLLLHGLGASGYAWRKLVGGLAASGYRVITLDFKGHGRSDKPRDGRYSSPAHARYVERFIEHHGLRNLTVIGHSLGGLTGTLMALHYNRADPGRIGRLVLIAAPLLPQPLPPGAAFVLTPVLPEVVLAITLPEIVSKVAMMHGDGTWGTYTRRDVHAYARPLYDHGAREALLASARQLLPTNWRTLVGRLGTVRQPALLIWCRKDSTVPLATGRGLVRRLPNARLHVLDGCDHNPHEDRPQATLHLIREFLDRPR